jgi:uncharacterized RDD family membrane protein YckC
LKEEMTERTTIAPAPPPGVETRDQGGPLDVVQLAEDGMPVGALARLLAYLLDAVIIAIVIYLVALILRALLGPTIRITEFEGVPRVRVDRLRSVVDVVSATTVAGAYFVVSWVRLGGTPMQRLFGMHVERVDDGGRLHPRQAIGRWLLLGAPFGLISTLLFPTPLLAAILALAIAVWYAVLFITTARDRRKRGLHDRAAGSAVRRRRRGASDEGSPDRRPSVA